MKNRIIKILFLVAFVFNNSLAQTQDFEIMTLKGFCSGKNIFVKHPFSNSKDTPGYSVIEVKVNGNITTSEINKPIFEIEFDLFKLKYGDSVRIEIYYKNSAAYDYKPVVLNPSALLSKENLANEKENHLIFESKYPLQNFLILNPYDNSYKHYCIKQLKINGAIMDVKLNKDVIEIDTRPLGIEVIGKKGLKDGDKVKIELIYWKGFDIFIINPEVIEYFNR